MMEINWAEAIDWERDYKREFVCPADDCDGKMYLQGRNGNKAKRMFRCPKCGRRCNQYVRANLPNINTGINWYRDYKVGEFTCPRFKKEEDKYISLCNSRDIKLNGFARNGKQGFICNSCNYKTSESIDLTRQILSQYTNIPIKPFDFEDDVWDARAINPTFHERNQNININFKKIQQDWFKELVKKYIYHLCKLNKSVSTVSKRVNYLRRYSCYLAEKNILNINQINDRSLVLDFLSWNNPSVETTRHMITALMDFIGLGNTQKWFKIDPDILTFDDIPKRKASNPDPMSDRVREQIEQNLPKLPEPIQRMWVIAFYTGMRPGELAFLKQDCLVQSGSNWSICWQRTKGKKVHHHSLPANRVIAKVIQLQQEYIKQLWGDEWDYLFCHYQRPRSKRQFSKVIPVKKVIQKGNKSTLRKAIKYLIETEDIRDENGELGKFTDYLARPTRATELFVKGHALSIVSAWLGHSQLATTANFYTQVSCQQIEKEAGHIQKALFNANGEYHQYESLPRSFWKNPQAHKLELSGNHINTPIYGYCGLPLDVRCDKFRACYTCGNFVAVPEKLPQYIKTRDELRTKEFNALANGQDVLVEQFGKQADQLDKIIASLQGAV